MLSDLSNIQRLLLCVVASCGVHGGIALMNWSGETAYPASSRSGVQIELMHVVEAQNVVKETSVTSADVQPESSVEQSLLPPDQVDFVLSKENDRQQVEPAPEKTEPAVIELDSRVRKNESLAEPLADDDLLLETRLTKLLAQSIPPGSNNVRQTSYQVENSSLKANSERKDLCSPQASAVETWIDAQPRYRTNPLPEYPYQARVRQWRGQVLLMVQVDANGRVENLEIERSSGHAVLDRAARQAVSRWEFMPALSAGVPVASQVMVPVRFELDRS
jgi:TonB family protein